VLAVHRDKQRFLATSRGEQGDRGGNRGLSDASLARDEEQTAVGDAAQF
jgi:hypothetical protein